MNVNQKSLNKNVAYYFLFIPTIMLIVGYFLYPYPPNETANTLVQFPIFTGLILLGVGFFYKDIRIGRIIKITGWTIFAFFWATSPNYLYQSEGGDIVNAGLCIIGVYLLIYIAYHEWLCLKRKEDIRCLNWFAGATFLAGIIYFAFDSPLIPIFKDTMIQMVAVQTSGFLNLFGLDSYTIGPYVYYNEFPIRIIFACTAVQSMVLFVGMILPLHKVEIKRKIYGLLVTIPPIYFLNLIRTSAVVYLAGDNICSVEFAHNILGKAGSLIALVVFAFIIFRILPELYEEILCIIDLPKRKGPIEEFFNKFLRKNRK